MQKQQSAKRNNVGVDAMALIVISVDRRTLPSHSDEQFEEWVQFNVGHRGNISSDNPLSDIDMTARVREISQ
ncbi:hypothetical protein ACEUAI_20910 [Aeromonas veronii]|nr:hypothetical protein [Aeromonas veronii]